ncbi:MAG TPA: CBS domain-containing protein, partial [Labilithrix sp.]|nr:CBS domain-containing protein [Labilithrix sp.]
GQGVGWLFVFLGLAMVLGYRIPVFGRGVVPGLWLALIGLFLRNVAVAHLRGSELDQAIADVHVKDLMRTQGAYVDASLSARALIDGWFLRHDELSYPVIDNGAFVGLVSIDDLRKVSSDAWETKTVRELMTPLKRLVTTTPDEELGAALRRLASAGVRQLPVLDDNTLAGMLYERDVARWLELQTHFGREARGVREPRVRHA